MTDWCRFCKSTDCGGRALVQVEVMTVFGRIRFGLPIGKYPSWREDAEASGRPPLDVQLVGSLLHADQRLQLIQGGKSAAKPVQQGLFL
jgi:hypothetical protein